MSKVVELITKLFNESKTPVKYYTEGRFDTRGRFCHEGIYHYISAAEMKIVRPMVAQNTNKKPRFNKKATRKHQCRVCNKKTKNYFLCITCHRRQSDIMFDSWAGI